MTSEPDAGYLTKLGDFDAGYLSGLARRIHQSNLDAGWWPRPGPYDDEFGVLLVAAKLCLIHSEISEAVEGHRRDADDDKLPHRKAIEVELGDAILRILDLAGALRLDIGGAIVEKHAFNQRRLDHKVEVRAATGGKRY